MPEDRQSYTFALGEAPLLLVSNGAPTEAAKKGTILLFHGLNARKELNQTELERFAREGFLAIGVDAVGHGERRLGDFEARFGPGRDRDREFMNLVVATVREVPTLVAQLKESGLAHDGGVGLFGISMGGFIGYGAAASQAVSALVSVLASPVWKLDVTEHPTRHIRSFFPCAVLSQVAGKDELVDAGLVRSFHDRLKAEYQGAPARQAFEQYPESAHFMRAEDWSALMDKTVDWFKRWLSPEY